MRQFVKSFPDGSFLEYDQGNFDKWCVYLTKSGGSRKAPSDMEYFNQLKQLADKYGAEQIYRDFVRVYDMTGKEIEPSSLTEISLLAASYGDDALEVDIVFSIIYMAMIAEERKQFTRLVSV